MNALAEYLDEISGISDFVPAGAPSIEAASTNGIERLKYATSSVETIWEAMPKAYRKAAMKQLQGFSKKLADGAIDISGALSSMEGLSDFGGPVVQAFTSIVSFGIAASKINTAISWYAASTSKMVGRSLTLYEEKRPISGDTLEAMREGTMETNPYDWVKVVPIEGYIKYVKPSRKPTFWSWEPSVAPLEVLALMFGWNYGSPKGRWKEGSGIPMVCGFGSSVFNGVLTAWNDCHPPGTKKKKAEYREEAFHHCYTLMNPLSYPWGFMSAKPGPYEVPCFADQGCEEDMVNGIFMRRQMEMLSVARVNMKCNGGVIRHMAREMSKWLGNQLFWSKNDLLAVDINGNATGGYGQQSIYIDKEFDSKNIGSASSRRWYLDGDGVVRAYKNYSDVPTLDLTEVGFRYRKTALQEGVIITIAQYNAVIRGALAFFTFRRICLLDRNACRAWVDEGFEKTLSDAGLAEAIRASAKGKSAVGVDAAPPKRGPGAPPPRGPGSSRPSTRPISRSRTRPPSFRESVDEKPPAGTRVAGWIAGITGVGALGLGGFLLSRRFL